MVQRLLFVLSPLVLACAVAAPPAGVIKTDANAKLRDTRWVLSAIDGMPVPSPAAPTKAQAAYIVLSSSSQHLSGFTGCNQINGRFTQRGTQLAIKALGLTKRACDEPAAGQEQRLVGALGAIDAYRVEGSRLSLMQNETVRVVFDAPKPKAKFRKP